MTDIKNASSHPPIDGKKWLKCKLCVPKSRGVETNFEFLSVHLEFISGNG